jgi:hypothetical protein
MTIFLRALILGYATAALVASSLAGSGMSIWAAVLVVWIGGNVLALAFAAIAARLWPAMPAARSSFTVTDAEFRLWDDDLVLEMIDADLQRNRAPASARAAGQGLSRATG